MSNQLMNDFGSEFAKQAGKQVGESVGKLLNGTKRLRDKQNNQEDSIDQIELKIKEIEDKEIKINEDLLNYDLTEDAKNKKHQELEKLDKTKASLNKICQDRVDRANKTNTREKGKPQWEAGIELVKAVGKGVVLVGVVVATKTLLDSVEGTKDDKYTDFINEDIDYIDAEYE